MSQKFKILVFGGSGLVGSRIRQLLGIKYKIIAPSHLQVDVTNKEKTEQIIKKSNPDYIIYAAGLTNVDKAENNPKTAFSLNAKAPALIAKYAALMDIPMLYFSTDAVFNGIKSNKPYVERDKTCPLSVYGKSKLLGEQQVLYASKKNCIVRIIMVYSHDFTKKRLFVQIALDALRKKEKFFGIIDQTINPIYVDDVITAVDLLIKSKSYGIYHLGAIDYVTNYEFVKKLAETFNLNKRFVAKISFDEFFRGKLTPRAKFCWLDTSKFRKKFGNNILHSSYEGISLFKKNLALRETPQKYQ